MTPLLKKLVNDFQFLPGIGEKTALRFVHYIFSRHKENALRFANTLLEAIDQIQHCEQCRNLSETTLCPICQSENRNQQLLCVVEHPSTIGMLEDTQSFNGIYFVLHGTLSPIDGISPHDLKLQQLADLIDQKGIKEIVIATSSKIEGEATAYYIYDQFKDQVLITRLAYGIPIGGSLDYIDALTLSKALHNRQALSENCD